MLYLACRMECILYDCSSQPNDLKEINTFFKYTFFCFIIIVIFINECYYPKDTNKLSININQFKLTRLFKKNTLNQKAFGFLRWAWLAIFTPVRLLNKHHWHSLIDFKSNTYFTHISNFKCFLYSKKWIQEDYLAMHICLTVLISNIQKF